LVTEKSLGSGKEVNVDENDTAATKCRLCGHRRLTLVGTKVGRYRAASFRFYRCQCCSFVFVSPVLGSEIYDEAYYRGDGADRFVDYEREYRDYRQTPRIFELQDLVSIAEKHFAEGRHALPEKVAWLDFGCGAGALLKFLRDKKVLEAGSLRPQLLISGFDVGSYAERLAHNDGFKIWASEELENLPAESFEVVSCIEVVEHLEEPFPVLRLLARLLRPSGLFLLTTGNMGCPLARLLGLRFPYCTPEIHVSYFNPKLLKRVYQQVGLVPRKIHFSGVLRFKMIKNLPRFVPARVGREISKLGLLRNLFDCLYGVSAMPCGTKPEKIHEVTDYGS
jgi:2-polyprenyl-3-methyl-5-hydroxy-6-metoxy-1,4-benzoquinol methylase